MIAACERTRSRYKGISGVNLKLVARAGYFQAVNEVTRRAIKPQIGAGGLKVGQAREAKGRYAKGMAVKGDSEAPK